MAETINFRDWHAGGKHFEHREQPIFFRRGGRGGPGAALLLVHGFPTSSWDWHPLWAELCDRFSTVLAADMVGFGYSAKPRDYPYSLMDQADLQEALLRACGVTRYHVLAHDYGVTVAQELLARGLERQGRAADAPVLASACLLNGGLFPELHRPTLAQKLLRSPLGPWMTRLYTEKSFSRSFRRIFGPDTQPGPEALHEAWQQLTANGGLAVSTRLIGYIEERIRHQQRWVGALLHTPVPRRFINGPLDPVSGEHMARAYAERVPAADVVSLPGIGHYPQLEAPRETLAAFLEFFSRVPA